MWNGNNEVQTGWEHWDDRKAFKAALGPDAQERFGASIRQMFDKDLRAVVNKYAPGALYWGGSPTTDYDGPAEQMTDGDVHYWSTWSGAPLDAYLTTVPRFMSEFGLQSMPSLRTTRGFVGKRNLKGMPVQIVGSAYDSGKGNGRILQYLRDDYGEPKSFIDYIYLSQLLQAEGLEMAVIRQRASRPQSMGTFYWTLNDTWPGTINSIWAGQAWGSIDFYNRWKASHYRARRFYAPVTIGAQHIQGNTVVTLISDRRDALFAHWRLRVMDRNGAVLSERGGDVDATPLASTPLAMFSDADLLAKADPRRTVAIADLSVAGKIVARQFSYFVHARELVLADPLLEADIVPGPGGYVLTVSAKSLARGVWIDFGDVDVSLSDNAFDLAGGESVTVSVISTASLQALRHALSVRSFYGATK